jgi:hypothetical protein
MLDADNPWKEVCAKKLPLVLALLFRRVHRSLSWEQDYESLDQELRKLAPELRTGKRIADRLIKAFSRVRDQEKSEARYFHLEVQGKKEKGFERRMHIYNYRAEDRFGQPVASLAILVDEDPNWRPTRYVAGFYPIKRRPTQEEQGQGPDTPMRPRRRRYRAERTLRFLMVKLIDFRGREAELEALDNPMGLFVVAHLEGLRTRSNPEERGRTTWSVIMRSGGKGVAPSPPLPGVAKRTPGCRRRSTGRHAAAAPPRPLVPTRTSLSP